LKYLGFILLILLPGVLYAGLLSDGTDAYTKVVELHHKMNNMYFYSAMGLLGLSITAIGRIRSLGGQMRPGLSLTVSIFLRTVNIICILLLALHFLPDTGAVIDWALRFIGRVF